MNIYNCIKFIKDFFSSIFNKTEESSNINFFSLGPTDNASNIEVYSVPLDSAIKDDSVKNIAISGGYASGKSSVILSFFNSNKGKMYKTLYISLAEFNNFIDDKYNNFNNINNKGEKVEYLQSIEKSIIQQILYSVPQSKVPLSSFKRLNKHSKIRMFCLEMFIILGLISLLIIFNTEIYFYSINRINDVIEKLGSYFGTIIILTSTIFVLFSFYVLLFYISVKIKLGRFKINNIEIELNKNNESLFNVYLDEMIYFFQVSKIDVVIFEDLDRLLNSDRLLSKIREINILINNSKVINKKITFLYALQDDYFNRAEERTKFFDYILPIVPISSKLSSKNNLSKGLEIIGFKNIVSDEYLHDISIFIDNQRTIDSIINEYYIFKNMFLEVQLDDSKLLSMIVYKNLYPNRYSELSSSKGKLYEILNNKKLVINETISKISDEEEKIKSQIKILDESVLFSKKQVKALIIGSVIGQKLTSYNQSITSINFGNKNFTIDQFLSPSFDISLIKDLHSIKIGNGNEYFKDTFETILGPMDRIVLQTESIITKNETNIIDLREQLNNLSLERRNVEFNNLSEILTKYNVKINEPDLNEFELFCLKRGYIDERYDIFLHLFITDDLAESDYKFVVNVKNNRFNEFDLLLNDPEKIIQIYLNEDDFYSISVINKSIIDVLFQKNDYFSKQAKFRNMVEINYNEIGNKMIMYFEKSNKEMRYNFINELFYKTSKFSRYFMKQVIKNSQLNDMFVSSILLNQNIQKSFQYKDTLRDNINLLSENYYLDEILKDDVILSFLKELGVKFSNLSSYSLQEEEVVKLIENELLLPNIKMNELVLNSFGIDYFEFENKPLSILNSLKEDLFDKYILSNFDLFIQNCYSLTENHDEEQTIIEYVLNNSKLSLSTKQSFILFLNTKIEEVYTNDLILLKEIIEKELLINSLDNVLQLKDILIPNLDVFQDYNKITDDLYSIFAMFYNQSINLIKETRVPLEKDFMTFVIFNKYIDLNNLKKLKKISTTKFDNIDYFTNKISPEKIEYLITNNFLNLTVENMSYINSNDLFNLIPIFLVNNLSEFISNKDTYIISEEVQKKIIENSDITIEQKLMLINNIHFNKLINEMKEFFLQNVNISELYECNDTLIELYVSSITDINEVIEVLIVLLSNDININEILKKSQIEMIKNINNIEKNIVTLKNNEKNLTFAKLLKEKGYISSYNNDHINIKLNNFRK